jgi:iron(III) transport system ATP-binding protein
MPNIVECRGLVKCFGDVQAVVDLHFTVAEGEILAVLGPSGCGKTTLLRVIAGFEAPDAGELYIDGRFAADAVRCVAPERRRVGMVFQSYALFPHLTVEQNIAYGLHKGELRPARVREVLELVGLPGFEVRFPHELSGGQQQRVALARALAPRPKVLLLDEPFSNLDAGLRTQVRDEIRDILKPAGITTIFVTHDQEEALFMGDQVGIMNAGRLEQIGTPEDIFHTPATRFVAEFLGLPNFLPARVVTDGLATELGVQCQPVPLPAGTAVDVLVRPDDLELWPDPSGEARIKRSVFRGMDYLYQVTLPSGDMVQCLGPHTRRYEPGTRVRVALTPGHELAWFTNGYRQSPK